MSIEFVKYDAIVDELVACSFLRACLNDDGTVNISSIGPDERFIGIGGDAGNDNYRNGRKS